MILSSRFAFIDRAADNLNLLAAIASTDETQYYDAELGGSPDGSVNETQYFDPESGQLDMLGDQSEALRQSLDGGFGPEPNQPARVEQDAQTIPGGSAPVRSILDQEPSLLTNGASVDDGSATSLQCTSCAEAKTAACPCIQSILQANGDEDAMVLSVMTPEGVSGESRLQKTFAA